MNFNLVRLSVSSSDHFSQKLIPLQLISQFQGKYGIDLHEKQVARWGCCQKSMPISAEAYLDPAAEAPPVFDSPLEISFAQAVEYVLRHFNDQCSRLEFTGQHIIFSPDAPNGSIFIALINFRHHDQSVALKCNGEFVSWFDVICAVLMELQWIRALERNSDTGDRVMTL